MFTVDFSDPYDIYWVGVLITFLVGLSILGVVCGVTELKSDDFGCAVNLLLFAPMLWPLAIAILIFFGIPFVCVNKECHKDIKNLFKKKNKS